MAATDKNLILRRRRIVILAALALVIIAALLVFVFRQQIGDALGIESAREEAWVFESGYSQTFAAAGNGLAVASSTGLELLGPDGYQAAREIFALDTPAVTACDTAAAVWDVGGTALRLTDLSGNVTKLDPGATLVSVRMSEGGMLSVVADEAGYKGAVTVLDASGQAVYKWYSGESYPITSAVSRSGKLMAALCVGESGGAVHFFSLSSEDERGTYVSDKELFVDMDWIADGCLCAVSDSRAVFLDGSGSEIGSYEFGELYLTDYSFGGDGFVTLALSRYLSGAAELIVTVNDNGEVIGTMEPPDTLCDIAAKGDSVLCLYSDSLAMYSRGLSRQGAMKDAVGVKSVVIRKNGDVIAVSSAYAQIFSF